MSGINDGGPRAIPAVPEHVPMDVFENAIRKVGVVNACEWFGYESTSDFTRDTIKLLRDRAEEYKAKK